MTDRSPTKSPAKSPAKSPSKSPARISLTNLTNLDEKFQSIAERVSNLDSLIGPGDAHSLNIASSELEFIVNGLVELKNEPVSAIFMHSFHTSTNV